jgi:hypothetical protein
LPDVSTYHVRIRAGAQLFWFVTAPPTTWLASWRGFQAGPVLHTPALRAIPSGKKHSRELEALWRPLETDWLPHLEEFQAAVLNDSSIRRSVVFYPFSGPDVLVLTHFFPANATFLMVGLEPAGTLPDRRRIEKEGVSRYLEGIREAVYSELHRSFFITREMDHDFRGQVTDGLLPPILLLLARSGHTILDYRYIRLDEQGRIIAREANYKATSEIGNKGVEIDFSRDADGSVHKLYYFSVNLSDERLAENRPFLIYLSGLQGMSTFLKATSYMLHQKTFSLIRNEVLARSKTILQDDSGIPYKYFSANSWHVRLFGSYDKPYGSFRYLVQPDLRAAYLASKPEPLAFHIGYGFSKIASNLLVATRTPRASR